MKKKVTALLIGLCLSNCDVYSAEQEGLSGEDTAQLVGDLFVKEQPTALSKDGVRTFCTPFCPQTNELCMNTCEQWGNMGAHDSMSNCFWQTVAIIGVCSLGAVECLGTPLRFLLGTNPQKKVFIIQSYKGELEDEPCGDGTKEERKETKEQSLAEQFQQAAGSKGKEE